MRLAAAFTTKTTSKGAVNGMRIGRTSWPDFMKGIPLKLLQRVFRAAHRLAAIICPTTILEPLHRKKTDLFHRFKPEVWSKVAEEMAVPWRAAEAMHWQLGEADMARRAGVVPFSLSAANMDTPPPGYRVSPSRGQAHSQSQSSAISGSDSTSSRYSRPNPSHSASGSVRSSSGGGSSRTIAARRDSTPRSVPPTSPSDGLALAAIGSGMMRGNQIMLPSVAEMTTGVSPYSTPAYAMSMSTGGGYSSLGPLLPAIGMMGVGPRHEIKRRASPETGPRETSRRRQ